MAFSTAPTDVYKEKYAARIALKAKEKGCSVETLVGEASVKNKDLDLFALIELPTSPMNMIKTKTSIPKNDRKIVSREGVQALDTLINVDNFKKESNETVGKLWTLLHSSNPSFISGIVDPFFHAKLFANGKLYPTFVLPVQKDSGCEFFLMQFSGTQIQFTQLASYQANPQSAQPCLTMTHYEELESVVLMRGEVDLSVVSSEEARRLVYLVQLFYGSEKIKVVEAFSRGGDFDYKDIIAAADVLA